MVPASCDELGRYQLVVYPEAAEAFVMRSPGIGSVRPTPSVLDTRAQLDVSATDRLQEGERLPQSLRRSRGRIRRYSVANRCNVLVSPTYAPEHLSRASDRELVELDLRNLVRFIRKRWGERFPYVSMPEVQPERSEREGVPIYNGMLLVPVMPRPVFDAVREGWPYGRGDGYNGVDITRWSEKRGGAQYASKALSSYASKTLGEAPNGRQAYRVAEGFQPCREEWRASGRSGSAGDLLEVWADQRGHSLEALRLVVDDQGRSLDAAWGIW